MRDLLIATQADLKRPHVVEDTVDGKAYIRRMGAGGKFEYMDLGDRPYWFEKGLIERTFASVDDAKDELRQMAQVERRNGQPDIVVAVLRST